jgi:integrase
MHNDFTLFSRKVPSGKTVVYYYAYDAGGRRLGPWTTGQMSIPAARNYCNLLIRKGKLLPGLKGIPTFGEFSKNFWDWETSPYLKERRKRRVLTRSYTDKNKSLVTLRLDDYFGKMTLDKITPEVIEAWFDDLSVKKKISNNSINGYFSILKTMLAWAVKKKILPDDPTTAVDRLVNDRKALKIITQDEFNALFDEDWRRVWDNNRIICTANKLAGLTGMRSSEVLGLKGEFVYEDHIFVCAQYDKYGYRPTKTKEQQNIPLAPEMIADLNEIKQINGDGFLFSDNGGETPIKRWDLYTGFRNALKKIGFTDADIKSRGLNLHAWRHFCNTEMQ